MRVPLRGDSQLARFLPSRLADRSRSARPVRPQPATSIPVGGSKMHSLNMKRQKTFLSSYLLICLGLGRDVPVEFGAPGMGDTKPENGVIK